MISCCQKSRTTKKLFGNLIFGKGECRILAQAQPTESHSDWDTRTLTEYLNDARNFTGYSQVLRETQIDPDTEEIQKVVEYTIGLDQISQTTIVYSGGVPGTPATLFLLADAKASTRLVTDAEAVILAHYEYDAYGKLLNVGAPILTSILYNGEAFNATNGSYNLRQRDYLPGSGIFTTLDPYRGNIHDPQSLHKYLFVHADPVNVIDPNGMFGLMEGLVANNIGASLNHMMGEAGQFIMSSLAQRKVDWETIGISAIFAALPAAVELAGKFSSMVFKQIKNLAASSGVADVIADLLPRFRGPTRPVGAGALTSRAKALVEEAARASGIANLSDYVDDIIHDPAGSYFVVENGRRILSIGREIGYSGY